MHSPQQLDVPWGETTLSPRPVLSALHFMERQLPSVERTPGGEIPDLSRVMRAVAGGDRSAFALLYDSLAPAVYGVVRRIVRSPAQSEEVTQEVFLEVWQKANDWKPARGSAANWVMIIARARATDRVRSEQASRDRQMRVAPRWADRDRNIVEEAVTLAEDHDEVRAALRSLTDKQRVVIELAFYEGKTYVEVSETLGLPLGTVKTRMRDALLRMRERQG